MTLELNSICDIGTRGSREAGPIKSFNVIWGAEHSVIATPRPHALTGPPTGCSHQYTPLRRDFQSAPQVDMSRLKRRFERFIRVQKGIEIREISRSCGG